MSSGAAGAADQPRRDLPIPHATTEPHRVEPKVDKGIAKPHAGSQARAATRSSVGLAVRTAAANAIVPDAPLEPAAPVFIGAAGAARA